MVIGIDASRAFLSERTGIEEYSYQMIKGLARELKDVPVVLYLPDSGGPDFEIPRNWSIKRINWPFFWTQFGLSLELFFSPVDVLFVPAHVVPLVHPEKTVVTIHGLEYELCPGSYSFWERLYMRWSIRFSCRAARRIVAVSENTRKDLRELYGVNENKIEVVYEGTNAEVTENIKKPGGPGPYLLFIGRLEERKNVSGIIRAFEIIKEQKGFPHQLILAGKPGHNYGNIRSQILQSRFRKDIIETGYVDEKTKAGLLREAEVFLFPSFCEGFGLPILEAQAAGVPVVTSKVSSLPEVAGEGAVLVDPKRPEEIAGGIRHLIEDKAFRDGIISKGKANLERFSWERAAEKIGRIIIEKGKE